MKEQREAREESVQSIDREYNGYSSLLTELQSITDANGHVKAGYEDRAKSYHRSFCRMHSELRLT